MSAPLISIIIPVYRAEAYLRRGLDSLLQQTKGDWEAICINDGSPDGSGDILREYAAKDARIRVFEQENSGVSVARNRGIAEARGTYITFLDADDRFDTDLIDKLASPMEEGVDIILFSAVLEYEPGVPANPNAAQTLQIRHEGVRNMQPELLAEAVGSCGAKAYRRSFLQENELRFPVGIRQEDEVFYRCSMAVAKRIYLLPYAGYHYLQVAGSYMHSGLTPQDIYLRYMRGMIIVHDYYRAHGCLPEWEESLLDFVAGEMWQCELRTPPQDMQAIRDETLQFIRSTDIPAHFADDHRYRYLEHRPGKERLFFRRASHADLIRLFGITLLQINYQGGHRTYACPALGKARRLLRSLLQR